MSPPSITRRKRTFYWYDTETTGLESSYDRIVQFAGQRTDLNLDPIGKPMSTYVQLPPEIVPTAESFQITKIRLSTLTKEGIPEHELMHKLRQTLQIGNTCIIGYNNIQFDDNFLRFGMYRNLLPPYEHEFKHGNRRLDFLNIVRLTGALRPAGIEWPTVDSVPTFVLRDLAEANGIESVGAHDALADVNMTLAFARKVKDAQPKLWKYTTTLRTSDTVRKVLDPEAKKAVLHVQPFTGNARHCIAPVLPIVPHPTYKNRVIAVDLGSNVDLLLDSSTDELANLLFERTETDDKDKSEQRININVIPLNQSPVVAPLKALSPENIKRLKIDREKVNRNTRKLLNARNLTKKLRKVFDRPARQVEPAPAEEALYEGFVSDDDRTESANFWEQLQSGQSWGSANFKDQRLRDLYARLKTKIAPKEMSLKEKHAYHNFVRIQLNRQDRSLSSVQQSISTLLQQGPNALEERVLCELQDYLQRLATQYEFER